MRSTPLTILHVEDNPDHAALVARSLEYHQVPSRIHLVKDGRAALDYIFRSGPYTDPECSPTPDIVLLDLRLPKVGGLEVLQKIKSSREVLHLPVIILTSSDADGDIAEAYRHRANSYLVKPVDFGEFAEMMEQLGLYWLDWNRPLYAH
jgi:CheY-like chemotaxis protein